MRPEVRYLARFALGVIFLWASLAKLSDVGGFASDIHNYRMLPTAIQNLFAMGMVWIEILVGIALVANVAPRSATLLGGAMLVMFLAAIGQAVARNLDIDCGCFGTSDATKTGVVALVRDAVFLGLAWVGYPRTR